jgi:hypothetical protein
MNDQLCPLRGHETSPCWKDECGVWNPVEKRCSFVVISTKLSKAVELLTEIASDLRKE